MILLLIEGYMATRVALLCLAIRLRGLTEFELYRGQKIAMTLLLAPVTSRSLTFGLILGVDYNTRKSQRTRVLKNGNWRKVHTIKGTLQDRYLAVLQLRTTREH